MGESLHPIGKEANQLLAPRHLALRYTDELPQDAAAECGFPCAVWGWPTHHRRLCGGEITTVERAMLVEVAAEQSVAPIAVCSPSLLALGHRLPRHVVLFRRSCPSLQFGSLVIRGSQESRGGFSKPQTPDSPGICRVFLIQTSFLSFSWGWPPSAGKLGGGQPFPKFALHLPFWLMFANHWLSWSIPPQGFALRAQRWPLTGTRKPKMTTLRAQKGTYSYGWHFSHSFQIVYPNSLPK